MWKTAGQLALGLVVGGLLSACGAGGPLPPTTGGAAESDPAAAAAKTQREFQEYWAQQKKLKESGGAPASASAPAPEPVQVAEPEAKPQEVATAPFPAEPNSRKTFSQWWADRKQQKEVEEVVEAPVVQVQAPIPEAAPEPEKENWTVANWWAGRKKTEEPAPVPAEPAPAPQEQPAEVAQVEPEKEKYVLPIVSWWEDRKKGKDSGGNELGGIDLSGNFPTATRVNDWNGFVRSPYNNRFVDVKGVESGTLVADPRFDLSERKFFIVP